MPSALLQLNAETPRPAPAASSRPSNPPSVPLSQAATGSDNEEEGGSIEGGARGGRQGRPLPLQTEERAENDTGSVAHSGPHSSTLTAMSHQSGHEGGPSRISLSPKGAAGGEGRGGDGGSTLVLHPPSPFEASLLLLGGGNGPRPTQESTPTLFLGHQPYHNPTFMPSSHLEGRLNTEAPSRSLVPTSQLHQKLNSLSLSGPKKGQERLTSPKGVSAQG